MRRWIILPLLLLSALVLAAAAVADPGDGKDPSPGKAKRKGNTTFTFTFQNTDTGSCGTNEWAALQETRIYKVRKTKTGWRLTRYDRGTFTTNGGPSPGACETGSKHGAVVTPGVKGKFHGYIVGTVTGGTFNPNATCPSGTNCGTRSAFLQTYFPGGTWSCDTNSTNCKFVFEYTAPAKNNTIPLLHRHWQDKGKGAGTMLKEVFRGDIATA